MPKLSKVRAAARPAPIGGALLTASALIYGGAMAPRLLAEALYGPLCGGHAAGALHCSACYIAAGLALTGAGALIASVVERRSGR